MKTYITEREGQIDFFSNYGIDWEANDEILANNTDGVFNGNIFEFKLNISNLNAVLFQAIKYLSKMRVKGESIPATILLIDLNARKAYKYSSIDYINDIQKVYIGAASKHNAGFVAKKEDIILDYSSPVDSGELKKILKATKPLEKTYIPIDIDENCIVGWAERYYLEVKNAKKGDFLGDDSGTQIKVLGEIRDPKHFKCLINPYKGKTNEKFKYLMDCLNDRLSKKDLGAFYTPMAYSKKSAEFVLEAVNRAITNGKKDYIILDRCAGTGNLESALIGICDQNGDDLISHCVISTYEYYEYKVLNERIGDLVRDIIPPTEADVVYENGKVSNADAMSEDYINNPVIKKYLDDKDVAIILFENPPYHNSSSVTYTEEGTTKKKETHRKDSFVGKKFKEIALPQCAIQNQAACEFSNLFIWSGFYYYLRDADDAYILFSPVQYFKSIGLVKNKFKKGFLFNRKHFHASESSISCVYWENTLDENNAEWNFESYDIFDDSLVKDVDVKIRKVYSSVSYYNDRRKDLSDTLDGTVCNSAGIENYEWARSNQFAYFNDNIIGFMVSKGFNFGAQNVFLTRVPYTVELYKHDGYYLRKDVYLKKLPIWCSKYYPQEKWYEKDVLATTSDKKDAYTSDKEFLKSCLIYCCLSNQNKCVSFDGLDKRFYQNELCFDVGTIASIELASFKLDAEEMNLISLWREILKQARETGKCIDYYKYGVYQINLVINTFKYEGVGKNKKIIYDYPKLNGDIETLRTKLKDYYVSHIKEKMILYELIK